MAHPEKDYYENPNIIEIKSDGGPIKLVRKKNTICYHAVSSFDPELLKVGFTWHQVIVHKKNFVDKSQILEAIFSIVGDDDFYPVAYKESSRMDKFLVRNCSPAIEKLFNANLTIHIPGTGKIELSFVFNAAEYVFGQISPGRKLEKIVEKEFLNLMESRVLNLSKVSTRPELVDIVINLGNKSAFKLLCDVLFKNHEIMNRINGFDLSSNNIRSLEPLSIFINVTFKLLNLRDNKIRDTFEFRHLKHMKINELHIFGNPVLGQPECYRNVKKILPSVSKMDGNETQNLKINNIVQSTSTSGDVEFEFSGEFIKGRVGAIFQKYAGSEKWHQISIVHNGIYSRAEIVDAFTSVHEIYPCYYKGEQNKDSFLVRNCFEEMNLLQQNNLKLNIPNSEEYLTLTFKMNVANFKKGQVEPKEQINAAIEERFNSMDRLLDLDNFSEAKSLKNVIVSLSNPKILTSVLLQSGRKYLNNIVQLRLGNNKITSSQGMRPLTLMQNLKMLDLSNNQISSVSDLDSIPKNLLKSLYLSGNPLCKNYSLAEDYIKNVKKLFRGLTTLDGVILPADDSIITQKNFLCSLDGYDFVEQFVTTFFPLYDSPERNQLIEMYDDNAIFSMSFSYDTQKINIHNQSRIGKYLSRSRNIKKMENFNRAYTSLHVGKEEISVILRYLPKTEHDFFSFTTDTTTFIPESTVITITGVFQELTASVMEIETLFAFSRTFILCPKTKNLGVSKNTTEYKIVNDIYYISDASPFQVKNSFKYSRLEDHSTAVAVTSEDKENFTIMFQEMTGLKAIWCSRCFEDANWNFKKALQVFMEMMVKNSLPPSAFLEGHEII